MFTPYLLLGPQYNYLLSKNVDKDFQIAFDNYNKNSLGITTGAGTEIITGIFNLVIEYRYERDLTNPSSTGFKMRNYSHNILAGIIF
jgi:opacity protein-like surface antigen